MKKARTTEIWMVGVYKHFGLDTRPLKRLTIEEERELIAGLQKDPVNRTLKEKFVQAYIRLVLSRIQLKRSVSSIEDPEALVSAVFEHLFESIVPKFDLSRKVRFHTFAFRGIDRVIVRESNYTCSAYKVPHDWRVLWRDISIVKLYLEQANDGSVCVDEIAGILNKNPDHVREVIAYFSAQVVSLERQTVKMGGKPIKLIETIPDSEDVQDDSPSFERLNELVSKLSKREQKLIRLRIEEGMTFAKIGGLTGMSGPAASKAFRSILKKLEKRLRNDFL